METLRYSLLLPAIICLGLLLQSCNRDKDCTNADTVIDYKIDGDDLSKIPYKGFETLIFVRTTVGDTHTFVANGWKQYWGLTSTQDEFCPQKERYEKRELVFTSTTFSKSITVSLYRQSINKGHYLDVAFQNTSFYTTTDEIAKPYDIDTLTILNTKYDSIEVLTDLNSATPETYKCYYNETDGILRLFFENGETWDLLKQ